jgi:cell division protease FtsH
MAENKKPNGMKISPWWISGIIIAMFIILNIAGGSSIQDPSIISSSKLDELLNSGKIDKIIVYNKSQAEVFLSAAAIKDKTNSKVAKDVFGNPNKGPHYTSEIADAQNFENKLIKASKSKNLNHNDFKAKVIDRNASDSFHLFNHWSLDLHHEKNVWRWCEGMEVKSSTLENREQNFLMKKQM